MKLLKPNTRRIHNGGYFYDEVEEVLHSLSKPWLDKLRNFVVFEIERRKNSPNPFAQNSIKEMIEVYFDENYNLISKAGINQTVITSS